MKYIGKEVSRVDGVAKVTGMAKYAAEFQLKNTAYGYIVQSTCPKGTILKIDTSEAEKLPGVLKIYTHLNTPKSKSQSGFVALQSDRILFNGQPVALVIAETFEQARYAAQLIQIEYKTEPFNTELEKAEPKPARSAKVRGNPKKAFEESPVKIVAEYTIPIEHHNPIEPHAAIAAWEGDSLTIFVKTQGVKDMQNHLAQSFGIAKEQVHVISPFVGGAFGSALNPHYYPFLAAMAARDLKRPVKLSYTRRQMFTGHGYRPYTWQKVSIGATEDGKLQSIIHEAITNSSSFEDFIEASNNYGRSLYNCPNYDTPYRIAKLDLPTPTWMRAPGMVSGAFALECALDELAYKLKIDPLELRLINYAETDPDTGKPFSSKALRECYIKGAELFGWKNRKFEPRSMRDGRWLVGWGMATGIWGAFMLPASVKITYKADNTAYVESATSDIGPGTYTVITIIAAEFLGLPIEKVKFSLGDSQMPDAPLQGGSFTTASVGTAAQGAALQIKQKFLELARKSDPVFSNINQEEVEMSEGYLRLKTEPSKAISISELMQKNGLKEITETYTARPSSERQKYTTMAHGAQFVEVKADEELGIIKVTRVVETTATGRVINKKTSHSQEIGGVVWGIGMALQEATEIDHRYGRMITTDLATYHFPVNADIHEVITEFVEENDTIVNPLGIKGMGELCMVGIPAAVANAVFHATGKRIRQLPITPDKLFD
ncbi:MAG: xanthine dehydrogenase family protein molybdopterin-binding subunit [Pyrinomonadaceae bacterium]|nr:xanthine dehydrogenase family protein molybdopterin-binding subunit [Pyrinomonadaceae bacterium]MCX7640895.1 xanthine dehydrogenase family protein molybdopterin-binding subunit [Pyrinomonadaceae bacterium]MDW8303923.1 xanthine dehydrogenase family protein molybdopterin-binding subunit [Acidobacteriota bacterium]